MVTQPKENVEEICPRCQGKLLWNGRAMACISCSYVSPSANSEKKISVPKRNVDSQKPK